MPLSKGTVAELHVSLISARGVKQMVKVLHCLTNLAYYNFEEDSRHHVGECDKRTDSSISTAKMPYLDVTEEGRLAYRGKICENS